MNPGIIPRSILRIHAMQVGDALTSLPFVPSARKGLKYESNFFKKYEITLKGFIQLLTLNRPRQYRNMPKLFRSLEALNVPSYEIDDESLNQLPSPLVDYFICCLLFYIL